MTHLEEIEKIIEQAQKSGESAFITALKVTNVYERVTDHQVHILSGNICLTMRALDGLYCQLCGELLSEHLVTERGGACQPARQ